MEILDDSQQLVFRIIRQELACHSGSSVRRGPRTARRLPEGFAGTASMLRYEAREVENLRILGHAHFSESTLRWNIRHDFETDIMRHVVHAGHAQGG